MRTDPGLAREILAEGREHYPEDPGIAYSMSRLHALSGDRAAAVGELERAIEGDSYVKAPAREHGDFASLRDDPDFQRLTA